MTAEEVAKVLARIQVGDNRMVDKATLLEWVDGIGDLDFTDCIEAVRLHRRESTAYLQVAHVRENVRLIRARRARAERVANPRAIEPNRITLDRAEFDRITELAIVEARRARGVTS